jgi:hypothetical protein
MFVNYNAYLFPHPPQNWNADSIRQANQLSAPLKEWSIFLKIFGTCGALFAGCTIMTYKFKGRAVPSPLFFIEITSLAFIALGIYLRRLASRHCEGLTEKHRVEVALEELKKALKQLPVCQSEKELQDKLESDPDFNSHLARKAVEGVNQIDDLVWAIYHPTKEVRPRFEIQSKLTMDQKQDLLDIAYDKEIILYFDDYKEYIVGEFPKSHELKFIDERCSKKIIQSLICSSHFLAKHLSTLDDKKIEYVNEQLRALCLKWRKVSDKTKVLNPNIYMEDKDTVVIRGNCLDFGKNQILWMIGRLAPHVKKIKMERNGFIFSDHFSLMRGPQQWDLFQKELNERFPGQMIFVDLLNGKTDIWQENVHVYEISSSLTEHYHAAREEVRRLERIQLKRTDAVNGSPIQS